MGLVYEWWLLDVVLALFILGLFVVHSFKARYEYFKRKGVAYLEPTFLLGSNFELFLGKTTFNESTRELYNKLAPHKLAGYFRMMTPIWVVRDPELAERILVKDFSHFKDHGFSYDPKKDPLEGHLFNQNGSQWRALRQRLSPVFTSSKLSWMSDRMEKVSGTLLELLKEAGPDADVDVRAILSRYAIDVIGCCAFGLDAGALKSPEDCEFKKMADLVFKPKGILGKSRILLRVFAPRLASLMGVRATSTDAIDFFTSLTRQAFQHRLREGNTHPGPEKDFVDILLELKTKGVISCDDGTNLVMSEELLTAQSFIFLAAGWETVATLMTFTLYFLAKHPDIQDRARKQIRVLKDATETRRLGLEQIKNMELLDKCIWETLRLYPPSGALFRICNQEYKIGSVKIEKGDRVVVPVAGIQRDPLHWGPRAQDWDPLRFYNDNPLTYDPDQEQEETKEKQEETETEGDGEEHDSNIGLSQLKAYLAPFGYGPRFCIGQRFALLEAKMAVAKILDNFRIYPSDKMAEPIMLDPKSALLELKGGTWLKFTSLDHVLQQDVTSQ